MKQKEVKSPNTIGLPTNMSSNKINSGSTLGIPTNVDDNKSKVESGKVVSITPNIEH